MPQYTLRDKYDHSLKPWFFALIVCLAFHFLLFFLFTYNKTSPEENAAVAPKIVMLPLNDKKLSPGLESVIELMDFENPTLIVCPNVIYGFSSLVLPLSIFKSNLPADTNIDYTSVLTAQSFLFDSIKVEMIPFKIITFKDSFKYLTSFTLPSPLIPSKNYYEYKPQSYPNVSDLYTGASISFDFYGITDKIKTDIADTNLQKSTVIQLNLPNDKNLFPSGKVIESCGISELDLLALSNLTSRPFPQNSFINYPDRFAVLKIQWDKIFNNN